MAAVVREVEDGTWEERRGKRGPSVDRRSQEGVVESKVWRGGRCRVELNGGVELRRGRWEKGGSRLNRRGGALFERREAVAEGAHFLGL